MNNQVEEVRVEGVLLGILITAMWIMLGISILALLITPLPFFPPEVTYLLLIFMGIVATAVTFYVWKKV